MKLTKSGQYLKLSTWRSPTSTAWEFFSLFLSFSLVNCDTFRNKLLENAEIHTPYRIVAWLLTHSLTRTSAAYLIHSKFGSHIYNVSRFYHMVLFTQKRLTLATIATFVVVLNSLWACVCDSACLCCVTNERVAAQRLKWAPKNRYRICYFVIMIHTSIWIQYACHTVFIQRMELVFAVFPRSFSFYSFSFYFLSY